MKLHKRWVSQIYGTVHFTPVPPSMFRLRPFGIVMIVSPDGGVEEAADVAFEVLDAGDYEIVAPVGCQAAGVLRRKPSAGKPV